MVCTTRLKPGRRTSLSSSARTIGAGQEKTNLTTEMRTVLRSTYQNSESCRNQKL